MTNEHRPIDSEEAYRFLTDQLVKETGAFSKGVNKGLNIARSALRNPDAIPTMCLRPTGEPLTLEQIQKMDGEAVKVIVDGIEPLEMLALVEYSREDDCVILTNNFGGRSEYYSDNELRDDGVKVFAQPPAYIDQEKVWPGCEACKNASLAIGEVQFYGAFEGSIDVSGNIHYCPNCGRPITPVAKERQVERLEALKDGNQTH